MIIGAREGQEQKGDVKDGAVSLEGEVPGREAGAMGLGAGGVVQSVLAEERFRDELEERESEDEGHR